MQFALVLFLAMVCLFLPWKLLDSCLTACPIVVLGVGASSMEDPDRELAGIIATVFVLCLFISLPVGIFWLDAPGHLSDHGDESHG